MRHLEEIEENSKRLYEEALEALLAGKYASAIALSIFSFEEAAKFAIIKRESNRPQIEQKKVHRHEVKHEEIGELFWYWAIYSVLSKTFDEFKGFSAQLPDADPATIKFIENLSGGKAVDFIRYHMFKTEDEMKDYVREKFTHPELLNIAEAGRLGIIEKKRRSAIYVDLNEDRSDVLTTPKSLTKGDANEWFKIAWFGQEYISLAKRIWNGI